MSGRRTEQNLRARALELGKHLAEHLDAPGHGTVLCAIVLAQPDGDDGTTIVAVGGRDHDDDEGLAELVERTLERAATDGPFAAGVKRILGR